MKNSLFEKKFVKIKRFCYSWQLQFDEKNWKNYLVEKKIVKMKRFALFDSFNLTRTKIPKNVWWKNSRKCIRWKRDNFRHFQTLCGNAEIVQWGDEQKQGWIIELSLLLVFFSSTAVVGMSSFKWIFIHPSFRVWINTQRTLDFSLKKNDKRWSRGIVLEFLAQLLCQQFRWKHLLCYPPPASPHFLVKNEIETIFQMS